MKTYNGRAGMWVQAPSNPLHYTKKCIVGGYYTWQIRNNLPSWFRRLTARPPGFHPENGGSTPLGTIGRKSNKSLGVIDENYAR